MAEAVDDWQPVGKAAADDWQPVQPQAAAPAAQGEQSIPAAFVDRVARGALFMRDMYGYAFDVGKSAAKQAVEATKEQAHSVNERLNPTSDAYRTGRESGAWTGPGTQIGVGKGLFDLATLPLAPFGGALTEVIAKPYSDISGPMMPIDEARGAVGQALFAMRPGRTPNAPQFSRPGATAGGEQLIGGLPKEVEFRNGAELMGGLSKDVVEANLKRMWEEDGIHPAEAVHDARNDAFVKHDLTQPIEAFHGSPYDFTVFSKDKIGTGEGAQSFGHGLYFAEHPNVAEGYKNVETTVGGQILDHDNPVHEAVHKKANYADPIAALKEDIARGDNPSVKQKAIEILQSGKPLPEIGSGNLYQVAIHADRDHFIDWDKPLNQQNTHVQDALKSVLKGDVDWRQTAGDFIRDLGYGQQSSDILANAGIPGIKYLDQGSRTAKPAAADTLLDIGRDAQMLSRRWHAAHRQHGDRQGLRQHDAPQPLGMVAHRRRHREAVHARAARAHVERGRRGKRGAPARRKTEHQGLTTLIRPRSAPPSRNCRPAPRPHGCARAISAWSKARGFRPTRRAW
jgi:hypothetical protein